MTASELSPLRARVLLSMQRGLLGMVTPALRRVTVRWDERRINARFLYAHDDDENIDLVQEIETEVLADFDDGTLSDFQLEVWDGAAPAFRDDEVCVYMRRES